MHSVGGPLVVWNRVRIDNDRQAGRTLEGSLSAVSARMFATKYSFLGISQDPQDSLCTSSGVLSRLLIFKMYREFCVHCSAILHVSRKIAYVEFRDNM